MQLALLRPTFSMNSQQGERNLVKLDYLAVSDLNADFTNSDVRTELVLVVRAEKK